MLAKNGLTVEIGDIWAAGYDYEICQYLILAHELRDNNSWWAVLDLQDNAKYKMNFAYESGYYHLKYRIDP